MHPESLAYHVAFVVRCSGAATFSYLLAFAIGLQYPVWASISGIVVSQKKLNETNNAIRWRLAGTAMGIIIAVVIGSLLGLIGLSIVIQIAGAVAPCAVFVRRWPALRVSMWTVPIVYLSASPNVPLWQAGLWRGEEVMLGGLVGIALHWLAEGAINRLQVKRFRQVPKQGINK